MLYELCMGVYTLIENTVTFRFVALHGGLSLLSEYSELRHETLQQYDQRGLSVKSIRMVAWIFGTHNSCHLTESG